MRAAPLPALLASTLLLLACGDDGGGGGDDVADIDASNIDSGNPIDGGDDPDAPASACGTEVAPVAMITGTEGIAIAADGTIYYSQTGGVGRWVPGTNTPEDDWVALAGTSTVWGMAIDDASGMLYVATPGSGGDIWQIDTTAATPAGTVLYDSAGSPNGLTLGPDGAIYYGHFAGAGQVYRVDTAGNRTTVTTSTIAQPNGVLFDDDGTLLVAMYGTGDMVRLTLDPTTHMETGRGSIDSNAGNPDGLARDELGRYYVTDNGGDEVLRYDTAFANPESLLPGVSAAANMAFGRGALACTDLYVTSSGQMRRIDAGAAGVP
jgi:sugar lactone lactonase YvrE